MRQLLLEAMAQAGLRESPAEWARAVSSCLRQSDEALLRSARTEQTEVRRRTIESLGYLNGDAEVQDLITKAYERGGRGYSVGILLFKRSGAQVRRVRSWTTYDPPDGLAGLIRAVRVASAPRPPRPDLVARW